MKRFWSLCLLALFGLISAVPSGTAQEALFSFIPPKEGESVLVTDVSRIEIDAEVKAGGSVLANLNQLQSKLERSRIELLAVRDGRIRKIQTTYEALEALNKQNEVEERKDFPVLGKTYIVEDGGEGALSVTYPDGEPPGGEEVEYIRNNIRDLNGIIDTNELLVGRKLTIGERDPALEQELRSGLFESTDMGEVKELSVVFRGLREEREFRCGVFGIDILFYAPLDQSGSIELRLLGEVLIILDNCWLLSVHMEGPIAMSARFEERGQMVDLTGSGLAIITKDYEYSE